MLPNECKDPLCVYIADHTLLLFLVKSDDKTLSRALCNKFRGNIYT